MCTNYRIVSALRCKHTRVNKIDIDWEPDFAIFQFETTVRFVKIIRKDIWLHCGQTTIRMFAHWNGLRCFFWTRGLECDVIWKAGIAGWVISDEICTVSETNVSIHNWTSTIEYIVTVLHEGHDVSTQRQHNLWFTNCFTPNFEGTGGNGGCRCDNQPPVPPVTAKWILWRLSVFSNGIGCYFTVCMKWQRS